MNQGKLKGRTALITGAVRRVGREIALALAGEGVDVVVHHRGERSGDEANALCAEIAKRGVKAWPIMADFEDEGECNTLISRAVESAGRLDILINNASLFMPDTLDTLQLDNLMRHVRVNAWAPFVLCREFARLGTGGKVINLLDSRVSGYDFKHVGYILSKGMLSALTEMTAIEYAPGITVNAVAPGLILPPPGKNMEYLEGLAGTVPLRRHGGPADIADAVLYLLGNDFITGQVIYVDGGRHLMEYPDGQDNN